MKKHDKKIKFGLVCILLLFVVVASIKWISTTKEFKLFKSIYETGDYSIKMSYNEFDRQIREQTSYTSKSNGFEDYYRQDHINHTYQFDNNVYLDLRCDPDDNVLSYYVTGKSEDDSKWGIKVNQNYSRRWRYYQNRRDLRKMFGMEKILYQDDLDIIALFEANDGDYIILISRGEYGPGLVNYRNSIMVMDEEYCLYCVEQNYFALQDVYSAEVTLENIEDEYIRELLRLLKNEINPD